MGPGDGGGGEVLVARVMVEPPVIRQAAPSETLTFGRSPECDLVVGTDDPSVSRLAGEIAWVDGDWEVRNRSTSRPLYRIEDTGLRVTIPVESRLRLVDPVTHVAIVGSIRTHVLVLEQGARDGEPVPTAPVEGTETTRPIFTANEFVALVALLEGYLLEPPRHEPLPRTYAEAADRLGLPAATVRKRIENARRKLVESGVVELRQPDARLALAEFLLSSRTIRQSDLSLLDGGSS